MNYIPPFFILGKQIRISSSQLSYNFNNTVAGFQDKNTAKYVGSQNKNTTKIALCGSEN